MSDGFGTTDMFGNDTSDWFDESGKITMSFFDDEEDLHDEGLCDPEHCRFCEMEEDEEDDMEEEYDDDEGA